MLPRPIPAGLRVVAPVEGRMQARLRVRMVSADSDGRRLRIPNPGRVEGFECGLHWLKRLEQVATGTVPEKTDMMAGAAESLNKAVGDVTASVTAMFK